MKRSPAEVVIAAFGGIRATARRLDRSPASIWLWKQLPPKGLGGRVPATLQADILKIAQKEGLALTADDLIRGRR